MMKRILVPTDFSDCATQACEYAAQLCLEQQLDMTLLHVMHVPVVDGVHHIPLPNELMEAQREQYDKKLKTLKDELAAKYPINIECSAQYGLAADLIVSLSEELEMDMIVMGTNGDSGLLDKIFGSVSLAVSKNSQIPLLVLPHDSTYRPIEALAFAYDNQENIDAEKLFIKSLNKKGVTKIHILSVEPDKAKGEYSEEVVYDNKDAKEVAIWASSITDGLSKYNSKNNIGILAVKRHHRSFFNDLFHKSTTKALLSDNKMPLLIFN